MIQAEIMSNQNAAVDLVSVPFQIDDLTIYGIQVVFSAGGTNLVGVLSLEASNDAQTWITISGSEQPVTGSTNHYWNVDGAGYRWVRAAWDFTSGTGNITMTIVAKEPRNRF